MTCKTLPYSSAENCERDNGLLSLLVFLAIGTNIFYLCLVRQLAKIKGMQRHDIVLVGRMALIVPAYSFLMPFSFASPQSFTVLQAALILVEGYCLYSFFKLFIINAKSRSEIINDFRNSASYLVLEFCIAAIQKSNPNKVFDAIWVAFFQVFAIRPFYALAAALFTADLPDSKSASVGFIVFDVLQVLSLALSFWATIRLYLSASDIVKHVFVERKMFFLWFVIIMILIQTQILASGNTYQS